MFNDQNFNNTLTNDIVSFEQLGPGPFYYLLEYLKIAGWMANSVDPDQMPHSVVSDLSTLFA